MFSITIATFNIWKDCGDFPVRIESIQKQISDLNYDLICLQEDYKSEEFSSSRLINTSLKYKVYTTNLRKKIRNGCLCSSNLTILSKTKMEIKEVLFFDEISSDQRACQFIQFSKEKKVVVVANLHLTHLCTQTRIHQLQIILDKMNTFCADIFILCGDFNAYSDSEEIKMVENSGYHSSNTKETHCDGVILDYIFIKSNFTYNNSSTIALKKYSDHYCLVNYLQAT